ncbi:hypothetical protein A1O3_04732 [Capronia epimyces CBS 606.96]|uniref:ABM domain-containing protein n=1 Tax=Capronia epimyces CBS 606.96 TaxID=1182542 RepID=W9Y347_9EURO|nr:uncharacterized protein A1O3_04732 [Capronia epimyces CBS 606.96]EXJ84065.1 hypothetical protein A1O3_04732 [Capronia epimyces CBS 606.96]
MTSPRFYVIAQIDGADGSMAKWKERLVPLCAVSRTEAHGSSYYWGQDLDGAPDSLWGLEGYTHAVGFFLGHPSSDIFQREMALIDQDRLLRTVQGSNSPDYHLHHYDQEGGWLKRPDDAERDSKTSHVVVLHYWAKPGSRRRLLQRLVDFAEAEEKRSSTVQSCLVLRELLDFDMATLWLRTKDAEGWKSLQASEGYKTLQADLNHDIIVRTEVHQSQSFNGHLEKEKDI